MKSSTSQSNETLLETLVDLWKIRNAHKVLSVVDKEKLIRNFKKSLPKNLSSSSIFHSLSPRAAFELPTARNRNLITIDEQHQLRQTVIAIFGLSVGSHVALTWAMESRADTLKISDPDSIDATNLNRMRVGWSSVGEKKVDVVTSTLHDIHPGMKVISETSKDLQALRKLILGKPNTDIIVDEIDDMEAKRELRLLAREHRLPLVSAADVGDNVMVDVERYDQDPQPDLFLGLIPNAEEIKFSSLTRKEKIKLIINHIGFEAYSLRMAQSLFAIGGSIPTWPQLGATATLAGGVISTVIKKIRLGENVKSGRYIINLDQILVNDFMSDTSQRARQKKIDHFKKVLANPNL